MRATVSRRSFAAGAALAAAAIGRTAWAADQFHYRFAHSMPVGHPLDLRTKDLWVAVEKETNGRLKVDVFPNNTLGNDTNALAQVRSGAIDFVCSSDAVLSTIAPLTAILNVGFAFKSSDEAHAALNGPLGDMIRTAIGGAGVVVLPSVFDQECGR